jgi:predicted metal-binding membrane protein
MGGMPGTMGMDLLAFIAMWGLMMTAMMLPSAAPFAALYGRTFRSHALRRTIEFVSGYLLVWTLLGVPAFGLAWLAGEAARAEPVAGTAFAVTIFAAAGLYQLTPLKYRCLSHCRTPLGDVLHYANYRGLLRDLRVGVHHGIFCFSCCWSLMALMAAFGFMNLWAMVALATIVAIEKLWPSGEAFGRLTGVAAIALAVAVIFEPGLAPGLDGGGMLAAAGMVME